MPYGLTDSELKAILTILQKFPQIETAILFGSRAMGRHKKGSDIDIALKGSKIECIVSNISSELNNESPLPYYFDIVNYETVDNSVKEHVDRVGKILYTKSDFRAS